MQPFAGLFLSIALLVALASASTPVAQMPVAKVASAQPFVLDGRSMAAPGVTSWPLVIGDELATSAGPAVLFFHDGSIVKLSESSRVKLAGSNALPKVILLAGSLDYQIVLGSNLLVTNMDRERKEAQLVVPRSAPPDRVMPISAPAGPAPAPNPKFLIPPGSLLTLPPVSRRL